MIPNTFLILNIIVNLLVGHLQRHKRVHTGVKPYVCDICQNGYVDLSALIRHRRTHTGEKPYHCDICNKSFTQSSNYVFHKRIHTGERPYLCDVCGKRFVRSCDLLCHKRTHTGEKPYTCETCQKSFSKSSSLADHERTHTGQKPYKCDICDKSFITSSHLVTHKRTHTGEKPYKCDICQKLFTTSSALVCHRRIHTGDKPYRCDLCEKRFCQLSHVWAHKKRSHGVLPYQCDTCGESFKVASHLVHHKQMHSPDTPFLNRICGKAFPDSPTLAYHEGSHTEVTSAANSSSHSHVPHTTRSTEIPDNGSQKMDRDGDIRTLSVLENELQEKFGDVLDNVNSSPLDPLVPNQIDHTEQYDLKNQTSSRKDRTCLPAHNNVSFQQQLQLKNPSSNILTSSNSFSSSKQEILEVAENNNVKFRSAISEENGLNVKFERTSKHQNTASQVMNHDPDSSLQISPGNHLGCDKVTWKSRELYDENQSSFCSEVVVPDEECFNTTFVCSQCSLFFNSMSLLEKHDCREKNICKKECSDSNLYQQCMHSKGKQDSFHMEQSDVCTTCVCSQCGYYFHSESELNSHLLYCHGLNCSPT